MHRKTKEVLDIVDKNNSVIGSANIHKIYKQKLPHRVVHILIINSDTSEIYLQKRALTKNYLPGYYCTSAGGHVQAGETAIQAARRELKEELGIRVRLKKVDNFEFISGNHTRFISVFLGETNKSFSFSDKEVMGGKFLPLSKSVDFVKRNKKIHPQLKECVVRLVNRGFSKF